MASEGGVPGGAFLSAGDTVGPYVIEGVLGEGGMGQVFRASHAGDGRTVALKVLKPAMASDSEYTRRFLHEARAASEVRHPNLVEMLDFGEQEGHPYLAMRYVAGRSVAERVSQDGPLSIPETVRICLEVAAGLDELHRMGLMHRDVKSANIMLDADGAATLADFGLAKGAGYSSLTRAGQVMGTMDYIAPELILGESATPRSEVYSLGCVVYECLRGERPFSAVSATDLAIAILRQPPPDPCVRRDDCGVEFSLAVREALAKTPDRRPASAGAYAERLRETAPAEGS